MATDKGSTTKTLVTLPTDLLDDLRREAMQRVLERKASRVDTGAILREAVEQRASVSETVRRAYAVADAALGTVTKLMETGDLEAASGLLDTMKLLIESITDLSGGAFPAGDHLIATLEQLRQALEAKGTPKGKKGGRK